jgi:hypothetical protein
LRSCATKRHGAKRAASAIRSSISALAPGEPRYDDLDAKPVITVPTITVGSDFRVSIDGALTVHLRYHGSGHKLWCPLGGHSLQLGAVGRAVILDIYAISCGTPQAFAGTAIISFSVVVRRI